jgi:hypothetical protein
VSDARDQNDDSVTIPQNKQDVVRQIAQEGADLYFARDEIRKEAMRAIPYAFGTLPIRSVGDVIAHGSQGLTGTLIVGSMDFAVSHLPSSKLKTGKRSPVFVLPLLERE